MDKRYDHGANEEKIYQIWEDSGFFNPDNFVNWDLDIGNSTKKHSFCVVMPPPNANDPLHLGHAMFISVEDVMIRYHRMLGDDTLWLPGTDHAGIETQFVFEKKLKKQGKSRFNFDRSTLYQMIWDYVQENSQTAIGQMKRLGASADWNRTTFTLDPDIVNQVLKTFIQLNQEGLVYRDLKLVNFCPKCGTAFSELEIDHKEQNSKLYYLKYGPFTVATTRPETIFGDTAVAANPNDERYQKYIGQEIEVDYLIEKRKVKVIADDYVDMEFGTGALKITPLHDHNDYEVWQRHKDELEEPRQVIDFAGRLNQFAGKYQGLKAHIAREEIVKDLDAAGLLAQPTKNDYKNKVSTCYRCGSVIEPLPLPQFFIKVKPMVDEALTALEMGEVKIYGAGHDKVLRHWLENLRDWNISRQIAWGIRMPIWYKTDENPDLEVTFINKSGVKISDKISKILHPSSFILDPGSKMQDVRYSLNEIAQGLQELRAPMGAKYVVSIDSPGDDYLQETDTFDTWFSSGQWPVVTLKNQKPITNNQKLDFERFYPTSVMETAYDILPFWVMRMLMLGIHMTGKVPFENVYFHGLIRDAKGQKMSKSKGNVINPIEVVDKYGADALRMALLIRSSAGLDKSVSDADFKAARNFCNKLWNASRFVITNLKTRNQKEEAKNKTENQEFRNKINSLIESTTQQLNDFKFGLALDTLYNEFWHWYCDECIELGKSGEISQEDLLSGLVVFLKLLHPFVPFVTEQIWQELFDKKLVDQELLMVSDWPKSETRD